MTVPALTEAEAWTVLDRYVPRVLPAGWRLAQTGLDGASWENPSTMQVVFVSVDREHDGRVWLHVSTSFAHRLPTYAELVWVKETWIGREVTALQVFAPRSKHVNIHPYALHLWHCADGDVTPDFTRGGKTL